MYLQSFADELRIRNCMLEWQSKLYKYLGTDPICIRRPALNYEINCAVKKCKQFPYVCRTFAIKPHSQGYNSTYGSHIPGGTSYVGKAWQHFAYHMHTGVPYSLNPSRNQRTVIQRGLGPVVFYVWIYISKPLCNCPYLSISVWICRFHWLTNRFFREGVATSPWSAPKGTDTLLSISYPYISSSRSLSPTSSLPLHRAQCFCTWKGGFHWWEEMLTRYIWPPNTILYKFMHFGLDNVLT